jgi:hypothetical protein
VKKCPVQGAHDVENVEVEGAKTVFWRKVNPWAGWANATTKMAKHTQLKCARRIGKVPPYDILENSCRVSGILSFGYCGGQQVHQLFCSSSTFLAADDGYTHPPGKDAAHNPV